MAFSLIELKNDVWRCNQSVFKRHFSPVSVFLVLIEAFIRAYLLLLLV